MTTLLAQALAAFHMEDSSAEILGHNENLTFRVDGRFVLRIHKPAEGVHVTPLSPVRRAAELAFISHLHAKGLPVQTPVRQAALPDGTIATLLTYLPGQALKKEDLTPALLRQAGALAAQLHQAAADHLPADAPVYDGAHCSAIAGELRAMAERYHLPAQHAQAMLGACTAIGRTLDSACQAFIPIHADLSASNMILTDRGLAPIDFSLFGLGHPMHDLSILMGNIGSLAQRQAVRDGYLAAGGIIDLRLLNAGYALGLLEALRFHADTWPLEAWFTPRLERWRREMLEPIARGDLILNDDMYLLYID